MARTNPLTPEEHRQLGAELYAINRRLSEIGVALTNRYGSSSKVGRQAWRLDSVLDKVRSELDDRLAGDHPDHFDPKVYYPGGEPTDAHWDETQNQA
jgi:hypothetical protein